jgi:isopenicillin-N epimerase
MAKLDEQDGNLRRHWTLDPDVAYLNHGSFGACPIEVLAAQQELRARLERQPVRFFVRELEGLLDAARRELAAFLGADAEGLAFVNNATSGVNTVLRSLDWGPGDELLTTDHEYNACRNALNYVAERSGAKVVVARIPFPIDSPDQALEALLAAVTPRTRLALFDHVTSQTGLLLPAKQAVHELAQRGVETLVDGAHAPGMLELDLRGLGATYYTGNCHKWLCAPKGAAFLYVTEERRESIRPLVISHGANAPTIERPRFRHEFDWMGTDDPTPALCVPEAIRFIDSLLPGGWPAVRRRNRGLVLQGRKLLCEALHLPAPAPDAMIGSLASLPLPAGSPDPPRSALYADPLQDALLARGIEVPVIPWPSPPRRLLRISAQLYNRIDEYELLADALGDALTERRA